MKLHDCDVADGTHCSKCLPCEKDGPDCGDADCSVHCPHDEHDHGICLDCGEDIIDRLIRDAEDAFERED